MKNIFILSLVTLFLNSSYAQQTVNICVLRVEFQEDNDPLTSGNGLFMVDSVTTDPNAIDPAPHDRTYFNDQLNAAANYYKTVTQNRYKIKGTVFPLQSKTAYKLPYEMGHYNPNTSPEATNEGLSRLFTDAIEAAKGDADITFSDFDLVVIFHAGVGKDIGLDFDETPKDIPSLFLSENFLKKYLGDDFDGVPVDDGTHKVNQAVILPETENQEGIALAVTGIFVNNLGNFIGLYDLFSSEEQLSGVGRFDLMDAGLFNANGLIPSPPGAFSRELKGVDNPQIITNAANKIKVARFNSDSASVLPTTIRIPINDDEYYLIEYRGNSSMFLDSLYYEELYNSDDGNVTYLQVLKKYFPEHINISDSSGVLLSVDDYDLGLPGAGILIWHIDDRIIRENALENTINNDPENRGVDIEEADGIEDIGQSYTFWDAGYQSELGTWLDFWFSDNPAKLYNNEFSDNSTPNTKSNLSRASSFINISDFSNNKSEVMTFNYKRDKLLPGFPVQFGHTENEYVLYNTQGEVYSKNLIFSFTYFADGNIYAVNHKAQGLFASGKYLIARAAMSDRQVSLSLADLQGTGAYDALVAAGNDSLFAYDLTQMTADSLASELFSPLRLSSSISAPIVTNENGIWVQCNNDSIYLFAYNGNLVRALDSGKAAKDLIISSNNLPVTIPDFMDYAAISFLNNDAEKSLVIYSREDNNIKIYDEAVSQEKKRFLISDSVNAQFSLANVDADSSVDILYSSGNKLYVVNREGYTLTNFPVSVKLNNVDYFNSTPLLAKKSDGSVLIYTATKMGSIWGFDSKGTVLNGFPLSTGGELAESSLLLSENDNGYIISAVTKSGNYYSWQLPYDKGTIKILWGMANLNSNNNAFLDNLSIIPPSVSNLLPQDKAYNYPNPNTGDVTTIRYYLKENAAVTIRILDTAGDLVQQFGGPGFGGVDNEIVWNVADIASGVYLCQIEAKTATETVNRIIKIMVVH